MASSSSSAPPPLEESVIYYIKYRGEEDIGDIVRMVEAGLSEPYSIFTYRFFINNWPELCWLAVVKKSAGAADEEMLRGGCGHAEDGGVGGADATELSRRKSRIIGCVVSKLEMHESMFFPTMRGYIAMLAVEPEYRRKGIARRLVQHTLQEMRVNRAHECILETEITNTSAMRLYQSLGFIKHKRLARYYLNGVDAFRFKYNFPDRHFIEGVEKAEHEHMGMLAHQFLQSQQEAVLRAVKAGGRL